MYQTFILFWRIYFLRISQKSRWAYAKMKMITHLDNKTNNMTNLEFFRYLVLFINQQNRIGKHFIWIRNLHTLKNNEHNTSNLMIILKYFDSIGTIIMIIASNLLLKMTQRNLSTYWNIFVSNLELIILSSKQLKFRGIQKKNYNGLQNAKKNFPKNENVNTVLINPEQNIHLEHISSRQ